VLHLSLPAQKPIKAAQAGEFARRRAARRGLCGKVRDESPDIQRRDVLLPAMRQEVKKLVEIQMVVPAGVLGGIALMAQVVQKSVNRVIG